MTISEIARLAGVSISTVSKIMNHKDQNITPETREKVLQIAKEYNYVPYAFAQNASASKTFLLGVLMKDCQQHGRLLEGFMETAQQHGYRVIVCTSHKDRDLELKHITALCKAKVDGVLWEPVCEESLPREKYFGEINACVTLLNAPRADSFRMDYQAFIKDAAAQFLLHKHTRFSLLMDPKDPVYMEALAGYKAALFDNQLSFDTDSILNIDSMEWIPKIKSLGLTGAICMDYRHATALLALLEQYQYKVPDDFSLLAIADDREAPVLAECLSVMPIPFYRFGRHLCKHLLDQCEQHMTEYVPFIPDAVPSHFATLDVPPTVKLPHIIVVGSINIDTTLNIGRLPKLGETITTARHTITPGGKGINQAVGVAKLNHKVMLLGNVGNDLETGLIYSCLKEYGIDTAGIQKDKSSDTGRAYIQVQDSGESTITLLTGANGTLSANAIQDNRQMFHNCAYCLLQTEVALEAVEAAAVIARSQGVKTILKPSSVTSLPDALLQNTDIFLPNRAEMAILCNEAPAFAPEDLSRQADRFLQKGTGAVIITLGGDGCFLKDQTGSMHFPAADFIPMDKTGGSDAFISALTSYLLYGYDLPAAIRIANYAAGFCISRQGIVPALIDQTSLEKYIQNVCPRLLTKPGSAFQSTSQIVPLPTTVPEI